MSATRREFVKQTLLASAVAGAAFPGRAGPLDPSPVPTLPPPPPDPLVPYASGQPIYLADLDRCEPAGALTATWRRNRWKRYPFETDRAKGVMLAAGQVSGVPDLEYHLEQKGWYAISFGILSKYWESRLQVRFKGENVFSLLTPNNLAKTNMMWDDIQWSKHNYNSPGIEDLFWRHAELGGKNSTTLTLRQLKAHTLPGDPDAPGNIFLPCWLAYIKLVPLSADEVAKLQADRTRRDTRRLFAADDVFTAAAFLRFKTADDVRRQIEPYRHTDFSRMYWEAGAGDMTNFPSKVAKLSAVGPTAEQYRMVDRLAGQVLADFEKEGIDHFQVALDYCHEIGLEFHASYRVAGFKFPPPEDEWNTGGLYERHPEWRSLDRNGRPSPRLSYAFAGVRQFVYALQEEIVRNYPVDGICLLFNRRLPVIGYEPPLVDTFHAKYGLDPRKLAETDPRWLAHSAQVLTGFMAELRQRMQAEAARRNRPIAITAVVMGSQEENYGYGLDLDAWVRQRLVDTLIPYSSARGGDSRAATWTDPKAAAYFVDLTRDTPCKLALNLMPRGISPEDYKQRADALYQVGVENFFFWDCFNRINFDPSWTTLARLGHKEELAEWRARGQPPIERPRSTLKRIGDWDLSYQTPG